MDHYIVLDFEATCNRPQQPKPMEIIEFPSVVLDAHTMEVVDKIQIYVRPIKHPKLSTFCTDLTGIQQSTVDEADIFEDAFKKYNKWVWQYPNSAFITCGDWDLKTMLPSQCRTSGAKMPNFYRVWINIKNEFQKFYKIKAGGLAGMLSRLKMDFIGRPHSGLDDCVNTGRIWQKMIEDGYEYSDDSLVWARW
jgi:ERI1 exoribonuclease 3